MMQSKQARAEVSHVINGGGVCNRGVLAAAASGLSDFISDSGGDVDRIFGVSGIDPELLAQPTLSLV